MSITCNTFYNQAYLIFPWCYRGNGLLAILFTHKVTSLLWMWRTRLQVTQDLITALDFAQLQHTVLISKEIHKFLGHIKLVNIVIPQQLLCAQWISVLLPVFWPPISTKKINFVIKNINKQHVKCQSQELNRNFLFIKWTLYITSSNVITHCFIPLQCC